MKVFSIVLVGLFLQTAYAETGHHHDHGHGKSGIALSLNDGKKWSTDEALRKNMSAIHDQIKADLSKIQAKKMKDSEYKALGTKIKGNIDSIFANCKLTPKADAQLHLVLAGMLSANKKLTGKAGLDEKSEAVDQIIGQYKAYLKHFDHKGSAAPKK